MDCGGISNIRMRQKQDASTARRNVAPRVDLLSSGEVIQHIVHETRPQHPFKDRKEAVMPTRLSSGLTPYRPAQSIASTQRAPTTTHKLSFQPFTKDAFCPPEWVTHFQDIRFPPNQQHKGVQAPYWKKTDEPNAPYETVDAIDKHTIQNLTPSDDMPKETGEQPVGDYRASSTQQHNSATELSSENRGSLQSYSSIHRMRRHVYASASKSRARLVSEAQQNAARCHESVEHGEADARFLVTSLPVSFVDSDNDHRCAQNDIDSCDNLNDTTSSAATCLSTERPRFVIQMEDLEIQSIEDWINLPDAMRPLATDLRQHTRVRIARDAYDTSTTRELQPAMGEQQEVDDYFAECALYVLWFVHWSNENIQEAIERRWRTAGSELDYIRHSSLTRPSYEQSIARTSLNARTPSERRLRNAQKLYTMLAHNVMIASHHALAIAPQCTLNSLIDRESRHRYANVMGSRTDRFRNRFCTNDIHILPTTLGAVRNRWHTVHTATPKSANRVSSGNVSQRSMLAAGRPNQHGRSPHDLAIVQKDTMADPSTLATLLASRYNIGLLEETLQEYVMLERPDNHADEISGQFYADKQSMSSYFGRTFTSVLLNFVVQKGAASLYTASFGSALKSTVQQWNRRIARHWSGILRQCNRLTAVEDSGCAPDSSVTTTTQTTNDRLAEMYSITATGTLGAKRRTNRVAVWTSAPIPGVISKAFLSTPNLNQAPHDQNCQPRGRISSIGPSHIQNSFEEKRNDVVLHRSAITCGAEDDWVANRSSCEPRVTALHKVRLTHLQKNLRQTECEQ